jgi:hypothetical protein
MLACLALAGCAGRGAVNPSLPVAYRDAQLDLSRMERAPVGPQRPIVVVAGYWDPGLAHVRVRGALRGPLGGPAMLGVAVPPWLTMDQARDRLIRAVDAAFPSDDAGWTTEVDVVGFSMGGLVARYAGVKPLAVGGLPGGDARAPPRRLRIGQLYTIATPHRGARLAGLPSLLSPQQADMRAGSPLLVLLDRGPARGVKGSGYPMWSYVRLGDPIIGSPSAAVGDVPPYWVAARPLEPSHLAAATDPRILADIARRLRGEPPLTDGPPTPLP